MPESLLLVILILIGSGVSAILFTWKGIELNFLFQGVFGNQVQDGAGGFMSASGDWFDNQTRDQLKRWKKPGDITNVPEARLNRFGDFESPAISTRYVYDASYVRLKNLTLGLQCAAKIDQQSKTFQCTYLCKWCKPCDFY